MPNDPSTKPKARDSEHSANQSPWWKRVDWHLLIQILLFIVGIRVEYIYSGQLTQMTESNKLTRQANQISHDAIYAQQRPWVGFDEANGGLNLDSIMVDKNFRAIVTYAPVLKNFGNYPAQRVNVTADLVLVGQHDNGPSLEERQDASCSPKNIAPGLGDLIFPNQIHSPRAILPAAPYDIPESAREDSFQAFVVGCIIYKDQFDTVNQTGFVYWLLDPGKPASPGQIATPTAVSKFTLSPNTSINRVWQLHDMSIWKAKNN
jgi:hypothetical protein